MDLATNPQFDSHSPLHHWDARLMTFLQDARLTETLRGFERDMLVLNPLWEKRVIIGAALPRFLDSLHTECCIGAEPLASLDERKSIYAPPASGAAPVSTPSTINRQISAMLVQNRARNDASNRAEFLLTPEECRRRFGDDAPSCARVHAKHVDRDVQMKYDIAKNEEGPFRRTVKDIEGAQKDINELGWGDDDSPQRHPGLDERLKNIEAHFAVRYVPSPPRTLTSRLAFLEDHLIRLEKEFPPWAALHFNQPNRGWPPPPRSTPIIVSTHLRSGPVDGVMREVGKAKSGTGRGKSAPSSLHQAVLERLEVQKALNDLAGKGETEKFEKVLQ